MIAGDAFGVDDLAWIIPSALAVAGLGVQGAQMAMQETPETSKPNLPGAASPAPVGTNAGPTQAPFMGRPSINNDQRQSAALSILGRR